MESPGEQSRVKRAKAHAKRNKGKYAVTSALATAVLVLQFIGAVGPMLCAMPWVTDYQKCLEVVGHAKKAASDLGDLDSIKLDDGQPMFLPPEDVAPAPEVVQ